MCLPFIRLIFQFWSVMVYVLERVFLGVGISWSKLPEKISRFFGAKSGWVGGIESVEGDLYDDVIESTIFLFWWKKLLDILGNIGLSTWGPSLREGLDGLSKA